MDTPYRVERSARRWGNGHSMQAVWAIMRTGEDPVCFCDDVVYAYRLVELLNREHGSGDSPSP